MSDMYELEQEIGNDMLLDQIPDLPGYKTLLSGAYILTADKGIEEKEINDKKFYSVEFSVKSVEEITEKVAEGTEEEIKPGDLTSFLFDRNHLVAMSNFKKFICMPIAKQFNLSTVGECIEQSKGLEFIVIGKRTSKKKDGETLYNFQMKTVELA